MTLKNRLTLLGCVPILAAAAHADTLGESLARLSVADPDFVFHANLEDDFGSAGAFLSQLYLAYLGTDPGVPPLPVDFETLFDRLGVRNLESLTILSAAHPQGGFLNQTLFAFDGAPQGAFLLMGAQNRSFGITRTAPADASFIGEFSFSMQALLDIVRNLATDLAGPMGAGLLEAQLVQPLNAEGLTLMDILQRLNTSVQVAYRPDFAAAAGQPGEAFLKGQGALRVSGVADLLPALSPLLTQAGFTATPDGAATAWSFTVPDPAFPVVLRLAAIPDTNDLLLSLGDGAGQWFLGATGSIATNPEFIAATTGLPAAGLSFWYADGRIADLQIDQLDQSVSSRRGAALLPVLKAFLRRYSGPQAGVSLLEPDAYRVVTRQPYSYKTQLGVTALAVPLMVAASLPDPAPEEDAAAAGEGAPVDGDATQEPELQPLPAE